MIKNGRAFEGRPTGVIRRLKSERSIVFPLGGTLFSLHRNRVHSGSRENAYDVLAPRQSPHNSAININDLHCTAGRSHEVLLRKTKGSSQGGEVDASSASAGRAETETIGSSQRGAVGASSARAGRTESEIIGSTQGGAVGASSVPAGRAERPQRSINFRYRPRER